MIVVCACVCLAAPEVIWAQGVTYVSNLGEPSTGSQAVGSDSWIAQGFFTGTNSDGYALNSVQLLMNAASGNPGGFAVSLYSRLGNGTPGISIGSLSGSAPAVGGLFTYAASGLTLPPHTAYFVVATSLTPVAQGAYDWSAATGSNGFVYGSEQWFIDDGFFGSANGLNWIEHSRQAVFRLGINAVSVPEPSTLVLTCFSTVILGARLLRRAKVKT